MAKSENTPKPPAPLNLDAGKGKKNAAVKFDEQVIKEIMIQKNVDRETAIHILSNPTPQPDAK